MASKKWKECLEDCESALNLKPDYLRVELRKAQCLLALGNLYQSKECVENVISKEPNNSNANQILESIEYVNNTLAKAKELISSEDYSSALSAYSSVASICDGWDAVQLGFARALQGLKNYSQASVVVSGILSTNSYNSEALTLRASLMYYMGHLPQAKNLLSQILRRDPDNKEAFTLFKRIKRIESTKEEGNEAFKSRNYENAIELYSQILEEDPNLDTFNATILGNRGLTYMKLKKWTEAVEDLTSAIEIDSGYVKAYTRRAQCYIELEEFQSAINDYEQILQRDGNNREASQGIRDAKKRQKMAERKDYYKILGVPKDASSRDIKKAYRIRARECHPDKNCETEEMRVKAEAEFKDLVEAYEVLKDEEKRGKWDRGEDLEEMGVDMNDIFAQMFRGGMGGGMGGFGGMGGQGHGHRGSPFHF
eukprot:TRINITY_DN2165_c0_g1_i1.p1 TRINITY_DN2165_c0_g1~~TRINITY_DN2165_c0_g1_i1.p1  ORF type:complete len:425 (-),score=112.42 TRINITY_DN2165_c0_g1_i1:123-1397(-)